jgi:8-oxo-dGTP pyrophosphatase MutT (NUDIX family)
MSREHLIRLIDSYSTRYPDEDTSSVFRTFVQRHADCFKRSLKVGHITASAWILNPDKTKALMTHHKKLNRWLQLGGHSDGQSNTLDVALREAEEESGIQSIVPITIDILDLDAHPIPARGDEPEHVHYDVRYLFHSPETERFVVSDESHSLAWKPFDEIKQLALGESIDRMMEKSLLILNDAQ